MLERCILEEDWQRRPCPARGAADTLERCLKRSQAVRMHAHGNAPCDASQTSIAVELLRADGIDTDDGVDVAIAPPHRVVSGRTLLDLDQVVRERAWDTRVGTLELRVPRVRDGGYFPAPPAANRSCAGQVWRRC